MKYKVGDRFVSKGRVSSGGTVSRETNVIFTVKGYIGKNYSVEENTLNTDGRSIGVQDRIVTQSYLDSLKKEE